MTVTLTELLEAFRLNIISAYEVRLALGYERIEAPVEETKESK